MHRCLTIVELLCAIFEQIHCDGHEDTSTLAGLAQSCKTFFEPAIGFLWKKQDSLLPLLECIPQYSWEYSSNNCYTFKNVTDQLDWSRFDFYALRVRETTILSREFHLPILRGIDSPKVLNAEALRTLTSLRPHHTLLPNLQALVWHITDNLDGLRFIHAHLKTLHVHFTSYDLHFGDRFAHAMLQIRERCPSLRYLTLVLETDMISGCIPTCEIENFQSLRGFEVRYGSSFVHPPFIRPLAGIPQLEQLAVKFDPRLPSSRSYVGPDSNHPISAPSDAFPSLHRLSLLVSRGDEWSEVEPLLLCSPLRDIQLHFKRSALPRLADIAGRLPHFQTLTSLDFASDRRDAEYFSLCAKTVRPLFALKYLQSLSFACYPHPGVDNELLREIFMAWPKLIVLRLPLMIPKHVASYTWSDVGFESSPRGVTGLTPACFESIARYGANLQALDITLDASDYNFSLDGPCPWVDDHGEPVRNLSLSSLRYRSPGAYIADAFLRLLHQLFPNLPDQNIESRWK